MGSIPLPALHIAGAQDPTEQIGKIAALKGMLQQQQQQAAMAPLQQQMAQQSVQAGQLENEARMAEQKSQKALMQAYTEANGDLNKAVPLAAKYGARPDAVVKLREAAIKQQSDNLDLINKQGARALQEADLMQGAHDQVAAAKPEDRATVYQQSLAGLQNAGVDVSHIPPQYPGDDAFKIIGIGLKGHKAQLEELSKQAEIAKTQAETNKFNAEVQGSSGPLAEARYRRVLSDLSAGKHVSDDDLNFAKGFELSNRKTTTSSDTLGVTSTNTSAPAGLASVGKRQGGSIVPAAGPAAPAAPSRPAAASPASTKESIVDMVGNYKLNPTMLQRMSTKHPEILAMVGQKYPDFDQTTYNAKNKLINDYTSGTHSKEINAINTAMGHVAVLDQAVDALNNGDIRVLNAIGNKLGIEVGQQPAAAFKLIVHRVGPEISSAYIPGGGGEKERIADAKDFDENLAPGTLHNNAAITVKLLRSKVGALENQYKNTVERDDFGKRFITPEAQASFDRFTNAGGAGGGGGKAPAGPPPGATHTAMGSDKKRHYTNDKGEDLGLVP